MITKLKTWYQDKQRNRRMTMFMKLYMDPKTTMDQIVREAAIKMARAAFMQMLDNEGFAHCAVCPVRGPLKKLIDKGPLMCDIHFSAAIAAHEKLKSTPTKGDSNATSPAANTGIKATV
jgi:hypothetical protein